MSLSLAEANRAMQATLAKADNLAVNISVAVCDADGRLIAFQRMDGTLSEAHRAAYGKALASATSGRPSGDESLQASEHHRTGTVIGEGVAPMRRPGGLPIIRGGQVEGALGLAGATNEECVQCALAGIGTFTSLD
jgi:glc operon protein GlcG